MKQGREQDFGSLFRQIVLLFLIMAVFICYFFLQNDSHSFAKYNL